MRSFRKAIATLLTISLCLNGVPASALQEVVSQDSAEEEQDAVLEDAQADVEEMVQADVEEEQIDVAGEAEQAEEALAATVAEDGENPGENDDTTPSDENNGDESQQELTFETVESDGVATGVVITSYTGTSPNVVVPATFDVQVGEESQTLSVVAIGDEAFKEKTELESVMLPASVTTIGARAFEGCAALKTVAVIQSESEQPAEEGEQTTTPDPEPTAGDETGDTSDPEPTAGDETGDAGDPEPTTGDETGDMGDPVPTGIALPASVTSIGVGCFSSCTSLASFESLGLTEVSDEAFLGCSNLSAVNLNEGVTAIGVRAFEGCTSLGSVSDTQAEEATEGDATATGVMLPASLTSIGANAFSGCTGLMSVMLPQSVTEIGDGIFQGCTALTSVTLPDNLTTIGASAFGGCTALTAVTLPTNLTAVSANAFSDCTSLASVTLPDNLATIGANAFSGCTGLTSMTIPAGVTGIGDGIFKDCTGLERVEFQCGVTAVTAGLFEGCTNISEVVFGGEVGTIEENCFAGRTSLQSVSFVNGPAVLSDGCFSGCTKLASVTLPGNLTSIGASAFAGCTSLANVSDGQAEQAGGDDGGQGTDIADEQLGGNELDLLVIGDSTQSGEDATDPAQTGATLPASLKSIGANAFSGCTGLTSITIPAGVTSIGDGAFSDCKGLTSITIPASVTSIGDRPFQGCTNLKRIEFQCNVATVKKSFFAGCNKLNKVVFVGQVGTIEKECFADKSFLNTVSFADGPSVLSDGCFKNCKSLSSVTLPSNLTSIGTSAFEGCTSLAAITLPANVTSIGASAFSGCTALTSIAIPAKVTTIGDSAFAGCKKLVTASLSEGLASIGASAFEGTALATVTLPKSTKTIGAGCFRNCTSLKTFTAKGLTAIPDYACYNCGKLTSLNVKDDTALKSIGEYAFGECVSLKSTTLPTSCTNVAFTAFPYTEWRPVSEVTMTCTRRNDLAAEVLKLVNQQRSKAKPSLPALAVNQQLMDAAVLRAGEVAALFSDTRPNGTEFYSIHSLTEVENFAAGSATAKVFVDACMGSDALKDNILSSTYTTTGIGVIEHGGKLYWVQLFGTSARGATAAATQADGDSSNPTLAQTLRLVNGEFECWGGESTQKVSFSAKINAKSSMQFGETQTATAKIACSAFGSSFTPNNVTWTSSNNSVVTVSAAGKVQAKKAGTATITAKVGGTNGFSATAKVTVNPVSVKQTTVTLVSGVAYTGSALKPSVTVKHGNTVLKSGTDYSVAYKNNTNVGKATITIMGKGNYKESRDVTFNVRAASIASAAVSGISAKYAYTGKAIAPKPTVKVGGRTLKANTDYSLSYSNNVRAGKATVTITGKGNYGASLKKTYTIVAPSISYFVHRQTFGWEDEWSKKNGQESGTTGQSKRLEGIRVRLDSKPVTGSIQYRTHVQTYGWESGWKADGTMSGTSGQSKRLEAIQIRLTGNMAKYYDVYYRVHAQRFGWMGWAKNGASAGTAGYSYRLEAIQIVVYPKDSGKPPATFQGVTRDTTVSFAQK